MIGIYIHIKGNGKRTFRAAPTESGDFEYWLKSIYKGIRSGTASVGMTPQRKPNFCLRGSKRRKKVLARAVLIRVAPDNGAILDACSHCPIREESKRTL
jgi:hypothetical protein